MQKRVWVHEYCNPSGVENYGAKIQWRQVILCQTTFEFAINNYSWTHSYSHKLLARPIKIVFIFPSGLSTRSFQLKSKYF